MKLVHKFTLWYLAITTVVLLAGGVLVFRSVVAENDEEEVRRVTGLIEDAAEALQHHGFADSVQSQFVSVRELPADAPTVPFHTKDTMGMHSRFQGTERQIKGTASFRINGRHYVISATSFAPEPEETITGVIRSISWIFVALLLIVGITSVIVSRKILSPFNASLRAMQLFDLRQKKPLALPRTRTREFAELNNFLNEMTNKALGDYQALKEFTENASHELQTPLAIMRGKLELLLESNITDEQAKLIMSAHDAIERLARTNSALALLTKLENREFQNAQPLDMSLIIARVADSFKELVEMKALSWQMSIDKHVTIKLNADLAEILLMNLLSNAIRHNVPNGTVEVRLSGDSLRITNTGAPPDVPTEQLFERFRKSNQSGDSTGLGLAIVRRICEVSGYQASYTYADGLHHITVSF